MQELIAAVASLMILTLMLSQFAANTKLFIEACQIERTVSFYCEKEYDEIEASDAMINLEKDLNEIPNVRAETSGGGLRINIDGVIGPEKALGIRDNSITIEKEISLRIKEGEENEEPDNNSGNNNFDGNFEQISDGTEYDSTVVDLD